MQARLARAKAQLAALGESADIRKRHQAAARVRRFGVRLARWTGPSEERPLRTEIQALRIGELAIEAIVKLLDGLR